MAQPTTTTAALKPEPLARSEIHHFLHDFDPRKDAFPKRIDPSFVLRALREELATGRPRPSVASQMVALAGFYDTRAIVPDLIRLLDRRERTSEDISTSIVLAGAVGVLGDDAEWYVGRGYYHDLLSRPLAQDHVRELLGCYAALLPKESASMTRTGIEAIVSALEAKAKHDPHAALMLNEAGNLLTGTLPRIEAAGEIEAEILALPDPAARLDRFVSAYLTLDERYEEIIGPWATRKLIRAWREGNGTDVVAAFRRALPAIASKPAAEALRARALHAIELIGGTLTPEEAKDTRPDYKRYDLLSND